MTGMQRAGLTIEFEKRVRSFYGLFFILIFKSNGKSLRNFKQLTTAFGNSLWYRGHFGAGQE